MQRLTPRHPYIPIDGNDDNSCTIYFYLFLDAMPKKKFPEAMDAMRSYSNLSCDLALTGKRTEGRTNLSKINTQKRHYSVSGIWAGSSWVAQTCDFGMSVREGISLREVHFPQISSINAPASGHA